MQASGPSAASCGAAYLWGRHSCLRPRPARHGSLPGQAVFVGHAFLWGRLSSLRPAFQPAWAPLTDCHPCAQSRPLPWSKPPGLPCRPLRGARSLACHTGSHAGGRLSSPALPQAPVCGAGSSCGARLSCGAGFPACGRLSSRPWRPLPTATPAPNRGRSRGASRQACHAGGHAGRATQSRAVREFQHHAARKTARSTSSRRPPVRQAPYVGQGFRAGLGALHPLPSAHSPCCAQLVSYIVPPRCRPAPTPTSPSPTDSPRCRPAPATRNGATARRSQSALSSPEAALSSVSCRIVHLSSSGMGRDGPFFGSGRRSK